MTAVGDDHQLCMGSQTSHFIVACKGVTWSFSPHTMRMGQVRERITSVPSFLSMLFCRTKVSGPSRSVMGRVEVGGQEAIAESMEFARFTGGSIERRSIGQALWCVRADGCVEKGEPRDPVRSDPSNLLSDIAS